MQLHARDRERIALEELQHAKALHALADRVVRAVRRRDVAQHVGGGADPVQVVRARLARRRASLCSSTPIGRCRRAASCAAARERSRPTVSGNTMPGNSTTLRTGTMISASSGSGRRRARGLSARPSVAAPAGLYARRCSTGYPFGSSIHSYAPRLAQPQDQATVPDFARGRLEARLRHENNSRRRVSRPIRPAPTPGVPPGARGGLSSPRLAGRRTLRRGGRG